MAETAEKLTLDLAQTVVIGRFNPYIVTPAWLVGEKVVAGAEHGADDFGDFPEDDTLFTAGGFEWEVSYRRMAVSAVGTVVGKDCGAKAADVIGTLSHTPIQAVGNNFTFVCSATGWGDRPTPQLGPDKLPAGVTETRWTGQFSQADAKVEVEMLFVPREVVVLRLNYDRRVSSCSQAQVAARRFMTDYQAAGDLIRTLFKIDVP